MSLTEEEIQKMQNTTVMQLAQQLEDGLVHGGWLHEETSVLEFIKHFLN